MKVPLFWVVIIAGLSVCAGGIVDDLLEGDCPDAVVDTVYVDYYDGLVEGMRRTLAFNTMCLTENPTPEQIDSASREMAALFTPDTLGAAFPSAYISQTFPESTFAYRWEYCGQIIDSLNQRLSGMVSMAAVEKCIDPVTNTWGGCSIDPDYEDWTVVDTLYWIFDYNRWDSLKQAKGW